VYDYIESFIKDKKTIPSCKEIRKWFTLQKGIKDKETLEKRSKMTKKEMIFNHLDTLFYDVSNDALKQCIKDTYNAFMRFFKKMSSYPVKKKYNDKRKSFYVDPYKIAILSDKVKLEKIANNQKSNRQVLNYISLAEKSRIPLGIKYYNPRVSYDGTSFYLSIGVDDEYAPKKRIDNLEDQVLGIDLNNASIVTSDNVKYIQGPKLTSYKRINRRKKRLQRSLSRKYLVCNPENKKRFTLSKNYRKTKALVVNLSKKLKNICEDNHNRIITNIMMKPPKIIVLEDLHIKEMSNKEKRKEMTFEEKNASKSITEVANRKFRKLLENRSYKYGVAILTANQYYPSTKKCSCCGQIKKMKIEDRIYECENCGLKLDRDLNAAINLANYVNKNN
jgi:putative transposase